MRTAPAVPRSCPRRICGTAPPSRTTLSKLQHPATPLSLTLPHPFPSPCHTPFPHPATPLSLILPHLFPLILPTHLSSPCPTPFPHPAPPLSLILPHPNPLILPTHFPLILPHPSLQVIVVRGTCGCPLCTPG